VNSENYVDKLRNFFLVVFSILLINSSPAILGNVYGAIIYVLSLFFGLLYIFSSVKVCIRTKYLLPLIFFVLFIVFIIFQALYLTPIKVIISLKIVLLMAVAVGGGVCVVSRNHIKLVLRVLVYFILPVAISNIITYTLFLFTRPKSLILLDYIVFDKISQYSYTLYFPFTLTIGAVHLDFLSYSLPRAVSFFREPGLYQMYLIIAFFVLDFVQVKFKTLIKMILFLSLLTTFSSIGYLLFIVCWAYRSITKKTFNMSNIKKISAVILGIVMFYFTAQLDVLRLEAKLFGASNVRVENAIISSQLLLNRPVFGYGLQAVSDQRLGIHLLDSLWKLGVLGLLLYLSFVFILVHTNYNREAFVLCMPIIFTMVFSQPIYLSSFAIFMFSLNVKELLSDYDMKCG